MTTTTQKIHIVHKPFMCFVGQFEKDKRSLCIGVKKIVLMQHKYHYVQLGTNKKTYKIDCNKALSLAEQKGSFFKDDIAIVPVELVSETVES